MVSMNTLLKIIFFPFIVVIGIAIGVLKGIFGARNLKYIPRIIVRLANETSALGAAFDEIKYPQVLAYAEENGTVLNKVNDYFEFNVNIQGAVYYVSVGRAHDGSNSAVLRSRFQDHGLNGDKKSDITNSQPKEVKDDFAKEVEALARAYGEHINKKR